MSTTPRRASALTYATELHRHASALRRESYAEGTLALVAITTLLVDGVPAWAAALGLIVGIGFTALAVAAFQTARSKRTLARNVRALADT